MSKTNGPSPIEWKASYLALCRLLVRQREALDLTQVDVATRMGVSRRTLQRWERGEIEPPAMRLFQWTALVGAEITAAPTRDHLVEVGLQKKVAEALQKSRQDCLVIARIAALLAALRQHPREEGRK